MNHYFININPRKVYYLKFIFEGYDNLAVVKTRDSAAGLVEIISSPENESTISNLLRSMARDIGFKNLRAVSTTGS